MWPSNDPLFSLITNINARKMRGTGEAVMKKSATIAAHKPSRIGYIVLICGALLGSVAATAPAHAQQWQPYPCYYYYCPVLVPVPPPHVRRPRVVEQHWDYWERRYPSPYPPHGYDGGYPSYPGGYAGGPRPRLRFGGVQYQYPQSPASYEYGAPPQSPYEYEASARPAYDYDASPRPPAGIPGGYYNAGYNGGYVQ